MISKWLQIEQSNTNKIKLTVKKLCMKKNKSDLSMFVVNKLYYNYTALNLSKCIILFTTVVPLVPQIYKYIRKFNAKTQY